MHRKPVTHRNGWGTLSGLLTGCIITLIGVVQDLQPETILLRSAIGGCAVACLATVWLATWRMISPPIKED